MELFVFHDVLSRVLVVLIVSTILLFTVNSSSRRHLPFRFPAPMAMLGDGIDER